MAPRTTMPGEVAEADWRLLDLDQFDEFIRSLNDRFEVRGPVPTSGAIVLGRLRRARDLPIGWRDEQSPGRYRASDQGDDEYFGHAVAATGPKTELLPARQVMWRSEGRGEHLKFVEPDARSRDLALLGVRPCEVAAISILERVLVGGDYHDPHVDDVGRGMFVAVVECARPAATCFCSSMGTGPGIDDGFDVALTELFGPHRFLVRIGSERGRREVARVTSTRAHDTDLVARAEVLERANQRLTRHVDREGVATLLEHNVEHPMWSDVAERCLGCANCTMVCPTCFCTDVHDVNDLAGDVTRLRTWSSCFDIDHSYLHGGAVRTSMSSRYRQWLTHKFSTWWDQFGSSGCVGCGRCVTWCPVGIDVTAQLATLHVKELRDVDSRVAGVS